MTPAGSIRGGAPARPSPRRGRLTAGILVLILLLAAGLRFYKLGAQSLWNDEGTSVAMAQRDLQTIAHDAAHDIHPPLYYWLLSGWVRPVGTSEAAVRSLSALLGVVLVALTYLLGFMLTGRRGALAAASLAAINPLQVYYSQEARMYMLAAVLAAVAVLALVMFERSRSRLALPILVLAEAAGLYTHYSFAFVILVLNLAFGLWLLVRRHEPQAGRLRGRSLAGIWIASQVVLVLLYLPWLTIGLRQVRTWPSPSQSSPLPSALAKAWSWLVLGPAIEAGQAVVPLLLAGFTVLLGAVALAADRSKASALPGTMRAGLLLLWLGLPLILIFALGLYREAYLKFLLVTAPAVSLLLSCGLLAPRPGRLRNRFTSYAARLFQLSAAMAIIAASVFALRAYYADPAFARDDYRAMAAYIAAVGRSGDSVRGGDSILLNAPGQQEVWRYYYHGDLPVYPLPAQRPLDPAATEAGLNEMARPGSRVFAVLWATDESDPARFIEGWLDSHAYKALDSWYGNVRLVVYSVPGQAPTAPRRAVDVPLRHNSTGDEIVLLGYSLLTDRLAAGDIAPLTLFWRADETPARRYKVFVHVLDRANQIAGQRDAEPGGGARLTTLWRPGEVVADNLGVPIHPATPPGEYRVEVGLYDADSGQRLTTPDGAEQVWLDPLAVDRPAAPAPVAALGMQHPAGADFGELTLLGYDAHLLGAGHQPELPLHAGDALHVNLYWRANARPGRDWQVLLSLVDSTGREWASVGGAAVGNYPTSLWQEGDVWRGQFNLTVPAGAPTGRYRLRVRPQTPDGTSPQPYLSPPFSVGP